MTAKRARTYGATGLAGNLERLARVGTSNQDDTLRRSFLHIVRGADRDHGPAAATELSAYIDRAMKDTGWSFTGLVARLLENYAQENCR